MPPPAIDAAATQALLAHRWPGNVRELKNALVQAVLSAPDALITRDHLPPAVCGLDSGKEAPGSVELDQRLLALERRTIEEALRAEGGNQTRAAQRLGITRRALIYRMQRHQLRARSAQAH